MFAFLKRHKWLCSVLALCLVFILITLILCLTNSAATLPIIGVWFVDMPPLFSSALAGLGLTGTLFILLKISELLVQAVKSGVSWLNMTMNKNKVGHQSTGHPHNRPPRTDPIPPTPFRSPLPPAGEGLGVRADHHPIKKPSC